MDTMQLTPDEIRTAFLCRDQFLMAQARAQMAQELEEAYLLQLREKYNLGPGWVCRDLLTGFEQIETGAPQDWAVAVEGIEP